jgi:uncharacterized protein YecE (DUF72 family)
MSRNVFIGTSGYSYSEWKGTFYPADLSSKNYLRFYSEHFPTTEINNTFYRFPSQAAAAGWSEQAPDSFRFSVKLTQKITHQKKLASVADEMEWFAKGIAPLSGKLAAILVQLPPYFRKDLPLLDEFLAAYGSLFPLALEFRHASWHTDEVTQFLADRKTALVIAETEETPAQRMATGGFVYIRLRKSGYEEGELEDWATWIRRQDRPVYVYLKHDQQAPLLATRLSELVAGS